METRFVKNVTQTGLLRINGLTEMDANASKGDTLVLEIFASHSVMEYIELNFIIKTTFSSS